MKITIFKDQFCTMRTKLIAFVLLVPFIAFSQKEKKGLPLKAERFFELSTTSGTWISLDVHPSGEKIVFDLLGDLYELSIQGGDATRITEGLGYHWELWSMQSGGISNFNALRIATILGAEAIGLSKDIGSIEAGKLADMVILEKNPLEDIRHTNTVKMVVKNGFVYDGESLDQLYPTLKSKSIHGRRKLHQMISQG